MKGRNPLHHTPSQQPDETPVALPHVVITVTENGALNVTVDGTPTIVNLPLGDFDTGEFKSIDDKVGVIRFLERVDFLFEETDAVGSNDFLEMWSDGLGEGERQRLNEEVFSADPGVFTDGSYTLRFNLSRTLY